jgi:hypothetical protein
MKYVSIKFNVYDSDTGNEVVKLVNAFSSKIQAQFKKFTQINTTDASLFSVMASVFDIVTVLNSIMHSKSPREQRLCANIQEQWTDKVLVDKVLEKIVQVFEEFNSMLIRLVDIVERDELDTEELKNILELFSQSDGVYDKIVEFMADDSAKKSLRHIKILKSLHSCTSYGDIKEGLIAGLFKQLCITAKGTIRGNDLLITPNADDRDQFYLRLCSAYKNLSRSAVLQPYVSISLKEMEAECDSDLISQLNDIKKFLIKLLTPRLEKRDYGNFSIWYDNLRSFSQAFKGMKLGQAVVDVMFDVKSAFMKFVESLSEQANRETNNERFMECLYELKDIAESIALLKRDVDNIINDLLTEQNEKDVEGVSKLTSISLLLSNPVPSKQELAAKLLEHKHFEGKAVEIFIDKAKVTAEGMQKMIKGTDINTGMLKAQYDLFREEYEAVVVEGLMQVHTYFFFFHSPNMLLSFFF